VNGRNNFALRRFRLAGTLIDTLSVLHADFSGGGVNLG
jgi:hypothetical protein